MYPSRQNKLRFINGIMRVLWKHLIAKIFAHYFGALKTLLTLLRTYKRVVLWVCTLNAWQCISYFCMRIVAHIWFKNDTLNV